MSTRTKVIIALVAAFVLLIGTVAEGCSDGRTDEEVAADICQDQGLVLSHWDQDGSGEDADQTWSCLRVEDVDTIPYDYSE